MVNSRKWHSATTKNLRKLTLIHEAIIMFNVVILYKKIQFSLFHDSTDRRCLMLASSRHFSKDFWDICQSLFSSNGWIAMQVDACREQSLPYSQVQRVKLSHSLENCAYHVGSFSVFFTVMSRLVGASLYSG